MLYQKFIRLVEDHAEQLTKIWLKEVKKNPSTKSYKNLSDKELSRRIYDVYLRFGNWVLQNDPLDKKVAEHYMNLGKERAAEGIQLSEVIYALILSRVVMWKYISDQGVITSSFDCQQALEFYKIVTSFFDKAVYFVAAGYETTKHIHVDEPKGKDFVEKAVKSITGWLIKEN
ncbi:MAG: RsbRD N-terminal domain-containing protein [Bacteroidetes bacterium]|nr:RsbRD N-terminal domain-containing protein [Bacteroidota bacterium]